MIILSRPFLNLKMMFKKNTDLPYNYSNLIFFKRGRDALIYSIKLLQIPINSVIVVPAFICNSIIEPIEKAGYKIVFVDIKKNFQFDVVKLVKIVQLHNAKAVLNVNYFGLPSNINNLVEILRPLGVFIIEDCCHNFLSLNSKYGHVGDVAIYSLRKTLPIQDGGALRINKIKLNKEILDKKNNIMFHSLIYFIIRIIERFITIINWPNVYSKKFSQLRNFIDNFKKGQNISVNIIPNCYKPSTILKKHLSDEIYLKTTFERMKKNYERLIDGAILIGFKPYLKFIPRQYAPQWAILKDSSKKIVPWLRKNGVGASHWPWFEIPEVVKENKDNFPVSNNLNSQLALIPIHQSISDKQISYILKLLKELLNQDSSLASK